MTAPAVNKVRRKDKALMQKLGFKTKKQLRKWQKVERRLQRAVDAGKLIAN